MGLISLFGKSVVELYAVIRSSAEVHDLSGSRPSEPGDPTVGQIQRRLYQSGQGL
jgi:hypothetical protein